MGLYRDSGKRETTILSSGCKAWDFLVMLSSLLTCGFLGSESPMCTLFLGPGTRLPVLLDHRIKTQGPSTAVCRVVMLPMLTSLGRRSLQGSCFNVLNDNKTSSSVDIDLANNPPQNWRYGRQVCENQRLKDDALQGSPRKDRRNSMRSVANYAGVNSRHCIGNLSKLHGKLGKFSPVSTQRATTMPEIPFEYL